MLTYTVNFRENYKKQDWKFRTDAIAELRGKFAGTLDSYYDIPTDRIEDYKNNSSEIGTEFM